MKQQHQGYFLIIAVILIVVIGLMGSVITYLFANRAQLSVAQLNGMKSFYIAESGLESAARLLTMPNISGTPTRIACTNVTGNSAITNTSLGGGTFTVTALNNAPVLAGTTLNGALTAAAVTINVTSTTGFASHGQLRVDREYMTYGGISGNSFVGVTRGASGTIASSHVTGARVSQFQCTVDSQAGVPNIASPKYERELQIGVQLQDGWLVANSAGGIFVLSRWNQSTELAWNVLNQSSSSPANLNAISMLNSMDGWAVGNVTGSNFIFLKWNGSAWVLTTIAGACGTQDLFGVSYVSTQEAWTVGGRYRPLCAGSGNFRYTVFRWNGTSWSLLAPTTIPADSASNQNLLAVHVIDTDGDGAGNIGFAVGVNGVILRYNGSTWTQLTSPTTRDLNGVFTVGANEAWAVGAAGVILKWNGSSWASFASPTSTVLSAILGTPACESTVH